MSKTAFITGVTGQDGAYLTDLLIAKGYRVYGAYRRTSSVNFWRLEELGLIDHPALSLVEYDLTDPGASIRVLAQSQPDEVYNLAAQSFVGVSFEQPVATAQITGLGPLHLLEAIRIVNPKIRFYQASTSEMYGKIHELPQTETTFFHPRSPYGVAKLFAHWSTINYRESYDLFACSGILFNHESVLRGKEFVTRKITDAVARIHLGQQELVALGNLDAQRDWGHAPEYVEGMYRMLQHPTPDTYVLATNQTWTIRHFVELAFQAVGIALEWRGQAATETGTDAKTGQIRVRVNPRFYRPCEVDILQGNPRKAKEQLGWEPQTPLAELCRLMVEADLRRNQRGVSF